MGEFANFISWIKSKIYIMDKIENLYHGDFFSAHDISAFTYSSHNSQHTPTHHNTTML